MDPRRSGEGGLAVTSLHVRRALDGDSSSLEWVISRLSPVLLAQARYRLNPKLRRHVDPEDLVNEVWMIALPRLAEFDVAGPRYTPALLRFLSITLLNRINNLFQKFIKGKPLALAGSDDPNRSSFFGAGASGGSGELAAEHTGVVTRVVKDEAHGLVLDCIEELDPDDREVIILRGVEQNPNKEVALLLDLEPNTVAVRYKRALERLRKRLPESVFDELPEE